jgi:hypothetical protein
MGGHIAPKTRKGKEKPFSVIPGRPTGPDPESTASDTAFASGFRVRRFARPRNDPYAASTVTTPGTALMAPAICGETL